MTGIDLARALDATRRLWPRRTALQAGLAVAAGWFLLQLLGGEITALSVASPVALGLFTFFAVGAYSALTAAGRDGSSTAAWALAHPVQFGVPPALGTALTVFGARQALTLWGLDESLLNSAVDGLARGAIVLAIVAFTGRMVRGGAGG